MFKKSLLTALAVSAVMCMAVPAAAETFTASNGVLSIDLPNDKWKEMVDPTKWIVLSDGGNMITVQHFANGEKLPDMTVADEHYVNVYQAVFSTQNEVFVITGSLVDTNAITEVCNMIMSAKVLQFDTKLAVKAQETVKTSEFSVIPVDKTMYVTSDGLNVRLGCSTSDEIIGAFSYGAGVKVTGIVQRNGSDYGWVQVALGQGTGYVSSSFLSDAEPEKKKDTKDISYTGNAKTLYDSKGNSLTVYEAADGYWYDLNGHYYTQTTQYEFVSDNGMPMTVNKPQSSNPQVTATDVTFTAFYLNGNATTLTQYTDGYYYSTDWVRYTANGNGSYSGVDGTVLYDYIPELPQNDQTSGTVETYNVFSQGSGRPVTIYYSDGWYSDKEGNDYFKQADGSFIDNEGTVYDITYGSTEIYRLISRGSGRPVTITFDGGAYLDEEGNEFIKQPDGSFIDVYGAEYDIDNNF